MTNYNDGKWHGWNGGECPVHPCSMVEGMYLRDGEPAPESPITDDAYDFDWRHDGKNRLIAFRVIKEHKEPREFWSFWSDWKSEWLITSCESFAKDNHRNKTIPILHLREVLP